MDIVQCEKHSAHFDALESLLQSEWADFSFKDYKSNLPDPFIVIADDKVVGGLSYTFFKHPHKEQEVLWVNAVFILPQHRGNALASKLIKQSMIEASKQGFDELFSYTHLPSLYASLGWAKTDVEAENEHCVMGVWLTALGDPQ